MQAVPNRHEHREHRLDRPLVAKAATASPFHVRLSGEPISGAILPNEAVQARCSLSSSPTERARQQRRPTTSSASGTRAGQSPEGVEVLRGDPHLLQRAEHGTVRNRADVAVLREAGLEVPRRGKDYAAALDPDSGDRWRLKGDRRMRELPAKAWRQTLIAGLSLWLPPLTLT